MRGSIGSSQIITVLSGKGGVGKSNLAVNLSIYLAARGLSVTLVDLDMGLSNADVLLNLAPTNTLAHVLAGLRTLDEIIISGPCGLRFVPGASGVHSLAAMSEFERRSLLFEIQKLSRSTDITVLDCGAGIGRNVISFADAADQVIVVTTPEPTAVTDAYAVIKVLSRENTNSQLRLFVNMAANRAEAEATFRRLSSVAQKFLNYSIANGGYMLQDRTVELAVRARCPFVLSHPNSNASLCLAVMAGELVQSYELERSRGGLLRRVAGLFV
ncbi:MAG: MinD/ParA family protein [Planctomycetes bacterium]|nr:MinD/ParA family protein [Planctomycetota bacterium]MBI3835285.1 MinD/ParA family protein [Planctomycetota bacterium]